MLKLLKKLWHWLRMEDKTYELIEFEDGSYQLIETDWRTGKRRVVD